MYPRPRPSHAEIEWIRSELTIQCNLDLDEEWAKYRTSLGPIQDLVGRYYKFWEIQRKRLEGETGMEYRGANPDTCWHNVVKPVVTLGLNQFVVCFSCDSTISDEFRATKNYYYDIDNDVWVHLPRNPAYAALGEQFRASRVERAQAPASTDD